MALSPETENAVLRLALSHYAEGQEDAGVMAALLLADDGSALEAIADYQRQSDALIEFVQAFLSAPDEKAAAKQLAQLERSMDILLRLRGANSRPCVHDIRSSRRPRRR